MAVQQQAYVTDDQALQWAKARLEFSSSELVSEAPWARVHKLNGDSERAYLKQLSPRLTTSLGTTVALAARFSGEIPDVISADPERGLLMLKDPRGRRLRSDEDYKSHRKLLEAYAEMQGRARHAPDLLGQFPTLDLGELVPSLLNFLGPTDPEAAAGDKVAAAYFLGRTRAKDYHDAFAVRADLLQAFIALAADLPPTLNHCDLRLKNAAETRDKRIVLSNWEHATVGPAGLSLQALFPGAATVATLFAGPAAARNIDNAAPIKYALDTYVEALARAGYAAPEDLQRALPAAVCAGLIQHLVWYADYPSDSRSYRRRVRRMLQSRLSDLLDLCDLLAHGSHDAVLLCALDYRLKGRPYRAEALLRRHVAMHPNDPDTNAQLARTLQQRGKRAEALTVYDDALELSPDDAGLHHDYGLALLEELRVDEAIASFRRSIHLGVASKTAAEDLDRASRMSRCVQEARHPDVAPTLPVSAAERAAGQLRPESVELARKLFFEYGVLVIENVFDAELLHTCREHFVREYADYFRPGNRPADALSIGNQRYQITFAIEGPFNNPGIYANPFIMNLMERLLDSKFQLGCTVCAASLPGAKDQHLHKDHRGLFTKNVDDPPMALPPFAITTMVPMVPLDEMTGTTTVRKGSHLMSRPDSANLPRQLPIVDVGSCFLMDMRLSHAGLGNKTDQVRPILNMVYQQRWFADNKNFSKQHALKIPAGEYEKIPEEHRKLFAWAVQPGPDISR